MPTTDKRTDAYIAKSAPFARPILKHLRATIHKACPDVTEAIKWSMPAFDYKGPLCQMAAFKQHVAFGFWKAALAKNAKAKKFFASLAPGQRGEYIAWITGAKQEATRATRLKTSVEWLAQGKRRNWKYETPRRK